MVSINGRELATDHLFTLTEVISEAGISLDSLSLIMVDGRVLHPQEVRDQDIKTIKEIRVMQIVSGG